MEEGNAKRSAMGCRNQGGGVRVSWLNRSKNSERGHHLSQRASNAVINNEAGAISATGDSKAFGENMNVVVTSLGW